MSTLLQEFVAAQTDRWPDAPAVVWRRKSLTFADLEVRSTQLARALRDLGCRRGDRVCVAALPGPEAVIAALAIYKADAIFVPLDVTGTPEQLVDVVRACEPRCLLTCASIAPIVDRIVRLGGLPESVPIGALSASPVIGEHFSTSFCLGDTRDLPSRILPYRNRASNAAQILFTPGAAGATHGVVLTHANIRRFALWANDHFGVMPGDRHLLQGALSSDLTTYAIIGTLAAGATLYPVSPDVAQMPARLSAFVREMGLTLWLTTPQTMSAMARLDAIQAGDLPSVRHVVWQRRDPLAAADLAHWLGRLRHARFTVLYGPVEATIASSYHAIPARAAGEVTMPTSIGRPRTDVSIMVLDGDLHPTPANDPGQICISGIGLSPGYWRDPEGTRAAFVRLPDAGDDSARVFRTEDVGSMDTRGLVHVTGTRELPRAVSGVELGQVEAAIASLGAVHAAAVVTAGGGDGAAVLCCAYVPVQRLDVRPADLRADLSLLVPPHMLPTRWRAMDVLPLDADGAVGREEIRGWFTDEVSRGC